MAQQREGKTGFLKALGEGIRLRSKKLLNNPYTAQNMNPLSIIYYKHLQSQKLHSHKLLGHKTYFYGGGEYLHALKEVFMENAYLQELPENAVILDCGSHIGISVIYLKHICKDARIIAFEPDNRNFDLLKRNISSHNLKDVEVRQEAVWKENTMLQFIEEGNMGSKIGSKNNEKTKLVKAIRLRDYLTQPIDFLKMDIEGAEYEVIKDIRDHLHFVHRLFIEYHGSFEQNHELLEILNIVEHAGFRFYMKEAAEIYTSPFMHKQKPSPYDMQLNIFCFRDRGVNDI